MLRPEHWALLHDILKRGFTVRRATCHYHPVRRCYFCWWDACSCVVKYYLRKGNAFLNVSSLFPWTTWKLSHRSVQNNPCRRRNNYFQSVLRWMEPTLRRWLPMAGGRGNGWSTSGWQDRDKFYDRTGVQWSVGPHWYKCFWFQRCVTAVLGTRISVKDPFLLPGHPQHTCNGLETRWCWFPVCCNLPRRQASVFGWWQTLLNDFTSQRILAMGSACFRTCVGNSLL